MDYDIDLQVIHTALLKADNLRNYKKLTNRGGNEEDFDNVVKIIQDILVEKKFLNSDGSINPVHTDIMRRTTFFLVLNSDINVLHKLVNNDDLEHLIWKAPEIPKCLLIHIIWKLKLDAFFCEIVRYSSQELALELLQITKDNMKYAIPEESIVKVNMLVTAAYESINRMFYDMDKMRYEKYTLIQYFECISYLMKFLSLESPNKPKTSSWKKMKRMEHEGLSLCNLMDLMFNCFKMFTNDAKEITKECEIYRYTFCGALDLSSTEKKDNNIMDAINDSLNKLNQLFTFTFKEVFHNVTVEKLCCWFEINMKDSSLTLQNVVGQTAYKLEQLIENEDAFDKELVLMLSGISLKPKPLSEIIKSANYKTVYENASKPSPEQKHWIEALIRDKVFFDDVMLIDFVKDNINLVQPEDIDYIFNSGRRLLLVMKNDKGVQNLRALVMKCFEMMPEETKKNIIYEIVDKDPKNNLLELPDYSTALTSYLNKVMDLEVNLCETYCLFVQNPSVFYERCIDIGVCNLKQAVTVMNILRKLKLCDKPRIHFRNKLTLYHGDMKFCGFATMALRAIQNLKRESLAVEAEKQSFLFMLENMISENIIDAQTLLVTELSPRLNTALMLKNYSLTLVYLEALDCVFTPEFLSKTVVLIGMVMEKSRWDLWTYNAAAAILLNHSIKLAKKYLGMFVEVYKPLRAEYTMLCRKLNFLTPLNRYHFKVLWGAPFDTEQYIPSGVFKNDVLQLSVILHRMTTGEVKQLFTTLCHKYSVCQSLHLLCKTVATSGRIIDQMDCTTSNEATSCVLYSCRNVAAVLQEYVASDTFLPSIINVLVHIIRLINSRLPQRQEETLDCFITVLSQVLGILKREPDAIKMVLVNDPLESEPCREILRKIIDT